MNIRPGRQKSSYATVKCKAGRRLLGQPHWPNVSYLMHFAGNQEASQWHEQVVSHTASHLVSVVLVPRERTVQQQRKVFVQLRQSGRGPTLLRRVHAAPAGCLQTPRPSMIRFKNIQMLVACSLLHCYSSLGPNVRRLYSGHSKSVIYCRRNISRRCQYVIQLWSLITCYVENFQAVFLKQITQNNQDENQAALITDFF